MSMMYMTAMLPFMLVAMVGGGGIPVPISIPPLPENVQMHGAAPEAPILFATWAGSAKADAASANRTEKLFAEPQVRQMMHKLVTAVTKAMEREMRREDPAAVKATTAMMKAAYYRPSMVYLTEFEPDQQGGFKVEGAWVMDAGKDAASMKQTVETLLALMPKVEANAPAVGPLKVLPTPEGAPVVRWGIEGQYVIFTLGEKEPKRLLAALKNGQQPKWMTALKKSSANIKRRALMGRVNVVALNKMVNAIGKQDRDFREFGQFLNAMGAGSLGSISLISGLDEGGYVERLVVDAGDKKPEGLMKLMAGTPIAAAQIRHVPRDAYYMTAFNMDLKVAYAEMRKLLKSVDANALQQFDTGVAELEQNLGVKLEKDVMEHLGPTWTLFDNGEDNGLYQTGLTATVEVRNRAGVERAMRTIIASIRGQLRQPPPNEDRPWRRKVTQIREATHRGHTIYYMNYVGGFGPGFPLSWTVTDRTFAMAMNPQAIRAHIDRVLSPDHDQSIAAAPQVMALLKADDLPSAISYADTPRIFKAAYPTLQFLGMMILPELQREGVDIDAMFLPNITAFTKHLAPSVQTVSRVDGKIVVETRGVLPISGGAGALILPAMLFATTGVAVGVDAAPAVIEHRHAVPPKIVVPGDAEAKVGVRVKKIEKPAKKKAEEKKLEFEKVEQKK